MKRARLADAGPEVVEILIRPGLHTGRQRLRGRVGRLVARHHSGQEVEDVTLHYLPLGAGTTEGTPIDVVLLRKASRQSGDVGFAHGTPPRNARDALDSDCLISARPGATCCSSFDEYTRPILRAEDALLQRHIPLTQPGEAALC